MNIVELPSALGVPGQLSLAILLARPNVMTAGYTVYLGNGVTARGAVTGAQLTLSAPVDDTLAIRINGRWVKNDSLSWGADATEFDLLDLADAAGVTVNPGDLVELFAKDTLGIYYRFVPWSVLLTFADGSTQTIAGGETQVFDSPSGPALPQYYAMASFRLGSPAAQEATSYQRLISHDGFAHVGALVTEYPATAPTIDTSLGLLVQLSGVDQQLDEFTEFNAFANDLLVFIGREIMSVAGATMVAPSTYRLHVVRARYGTRKEAHAAGTAVWLIAREDLQAIAHPQFRIGNEISFKVALQGGGLTGDAAGADPTSYTVTGLGFIPAPCNLRANGQLSGAANNPANPLLVEWDLPAGIDVSGEGAWRYTSRVQLYGVFDETALVATFYTLESSYSISPAALADLGGADLVVRVSLRAEGEEQVLYSPSIELPVETLL